MNELEIIRHPQIHGLHIFFDSMEYRTPHFHSEWELTCVMENDLFACIDAQQILMRPGDMILIEPKQLHEYRCADRPCTFLCMQVSEDLFPSLRGMHPEKILIGECTGEDLCSLLRKQLLDTILAYAEQKPQYELYCIGMAGLIMHTLLTNMPCRRMTSEEIAQLDKKNERLSRFLQYVDKNFRGRILLRDFAREEGLSMHYLSGFLRQTLNQSFQEYVATVRFNYACELMVKTDDKLLTICMDAGFSDYRYFSEAFQKRTGKTPDAYRQILRAGGHSNHLIRHSMHSREEFFTRGESISLCRKYAGS